MRLSKRRCQCIVATPIESGSLEPHRKMVLPATELVDHAKTGRSAARDPPCRRQVSPRNTPLLVISAVFRVAHPAAEKEVPAQARLRASTDEVATEICEPLPASVGPK